MNTYKKTALTQNTQTGFTSWESDVIFVDNADTINIELKLSGAPGTTRPKVKIMGSASGDNFGYLQNSAEADIEFNLKEVTNIRSLFASNVRAIKIVGSGNGSATSPVRTLTEIYVRYK